MAVIARKTNLMSYSLPSKVNGLSPISDEALGCLNRNTKRGARVCAHTSASVSSVRKFLSFVRRLLCSVLSIGISFRRPERTPSLYHFSAVCGWLAHTRGTGWGQTTQSVPIQSPAPPFKNPQATALLDFHATPSARGGCMSITSASRREPWRSPSCRGSCRS